MLASGGWGRHCCDPASRRLVAGGWWRAATSTAGREKAVQGVSCRRWRCWPSVQESSIYGEIQGVEAVEAGGSGAAGGREPARILSAALAGLNGGELAYCVRYDGCVKGIISYCSRILSKTSCVYLSAIWDSVRFVVITVGNLLS